MRAVWLTVKIAKKEAKDHEKLHLSFSFPGFPWFMLLNEMKTKIKHYLITILINLVEVLPL